MTTVTVQITLPAQLADEAQKAGLLTESAVADWLQRELDRRARADAFFAAIDQLAQVQPPLTPEEIAVEIAAHRAGK